jgi:hypothetical protein
MRLPPPVKMTKEEDHQHMMDLLHITGRAAGSTGWPWHRLTIAVTKAPIAGFGIGSILAQAARNPQTSACNFWPVLAETPLRELRCRCER